MFNLTTGTVIDYEKDGRYTVNAASSPEPIRAIKSGDSVTPGGGNDLEVIEQGSWVSLMMPESYPSKPAVIVAALPLSKSYLDGRGDHTLPEGDGYEPGMPPVKPDVNTQNLSEDVYPSSYRGVPGQRGFGFSSGVSIMGDYYFAELKAGEGTGVEAHLIDQLLRLTCLNMKQMTGGAFREYYTVGGEYSEIEMITPYVSEAKNEPFLPHDSSSRPFPRHIRLRGYQGDLEREIIQPPNSTVGRLLEIHKGHDGRYDVRSAKSLTFRKVNPDGNLLTREQLRSEILSGMHEYAAYNTDGDIELTGSAKFDAAGYEGATLSSDGTTVERFLNAEDLVEADVSNADNLDAEDYSVESLAGRDLDQLEYEQRLLTLAESEALSTVESDVSGSEDSVSLSVDHRGDTLYKLQELASIMKVCNDGSIVLEAGNSRIQIEDDKIHLLSPDISLVGGNNGVDEGVHIGGGPIALTSSGDIHLAGHNIMNITEGKTVSNAPVEGVFDLGAVNGSNRDLKIYTDDGSGWSLLKTLTKSFSKHVSIDLESQLSETEYTTLNNAVRLKVRWQASSGIDFLECPVMRPGSGGGLILEAKETMSEDATTYTARLVLSDGTLGSAVNVIRPPGVRIKEGQRGSMSISNDNFKVFELGSEYVEARTSKPSNLIAGRMWMREDKS